MDIIYIFNYMPEAWQNAARRLLCSIKSLKNQNVRIIVLNHSIEKVSRHCNNEIIEIHKPNPTYYNKPKSINYLVREIVQSEYFLMSDTDIVYPPDYVSKMEQISSNYKACRIIPFIYRVRQEMYTTDLDELYNYSFKDTRNCQNLAAGIGLIHKPTFMTIQGYDEEFEGFGPEDHCFNLRMAKVCPIINAYTIVTYHLWHEKLRYNNRDNNDRILLDKLVNLNDNIIANKNIKWGCL